MPKLDAIQMAEVRSTIKKACVGLTPSERREFLISQILLMEADLVDTVLRPIQLVKYDPRPAYSRR